MEFDEVQKHNAFSGKGSFPSFGHLSKHTSSNIILNSLLTSLVKKRYINCQQIFQELIDIPYAIIKGAILSKQLYGNISTRYSDDIDLLVSSKYLDLVKEILNENGFFQGKIVNQQFIPYSRKELLFHNMFTHQMAPFIKKSNNHAPLTILDVNHDIFWGESGDYCDMTDFLSHIEKTDVCGVEVKKLEKEYDCVSLCMHHYKDLNSLFLLYTRGIKIQHFIDLSIFFNRVKPNKKRLREICDQYNISRFITFCLWHSYQLFPSLEIKDYFSDFPVSEASDLINRIGLSEKEYKILPGGVSRWVLDDSFQDQLLSILSPDDINNIRINLQYM